MTDRVLFITGASSGIGAATARQAVGRGWKVALMARHADALAALADDLGGRASALALPGDASDLAAQEQAMAATAQALGGIDAVFANAGTGVTAAGTEGGDPVAWQHMIQLNIMGVLWSAKAAMPHLRKRQGHFVATGSAAGRMHIKGSVYGATKWFVHGFVGNLAEEMRPWGGRATVIAPGMVDTAFFDQPRPEKLNPEDVAASTLHALEMPRHADIREVFMMPVD